MRFISFSLKDLTKKWLYSLEVDSVTSWDDFVKVFFKKIYPIHKITLIRKNIMQFEQDSRGTLNNSKIFLPHVLIMV